jgi:hypothetical protein
MIDELEDRWVLGLRGSRVEAVTRGKEVAVDLDNGVEIRVSGNALLTVGPATAPGAELLRVSDVSDDQLQRIVGAHILSAVAFKSGSLRVVFSTRHHLNVRSTDPAVTARVLNPGKYEWSYRDSSAHMKINDPGA